MSSTLKTSEAGLALIRRFERCRLVAYLPTARDKWTIGWGATTYWDGRPVQQGDRLTQVEADALLLHHVPRVETVVAALVTSAVTQHQFDALVSFAYNVGTDVDADLTPEGLGDSTLLRKVNMHPNNPGIRANFMQWVYQKGVKLDGLVARRAAEADLYFS